MKVKPAKPGLIVRDPRTMRAIPEHGLNVPDTSYWVRRVKAGDVVELSDEEFRKLQLKAASEEGRRRSEAVRTAGSAPDAAPDTEGNSGAPSKTTKKPKKD